MSAANRLWYSKAWLEALPRLPRVFTSASVFVEKRRQPFPLKPKRQVDSESHADGSERQ